MKRHILLLMVMLGSLPMMCFGWGTEHIGPLDKNSTEVMYNHNDKPKGVEALHYHPSRVYSRWVNGREDIYFKVDVAAANELLASFAKLPLKSHACLIDAKTDGLACTFKNDDIQYNLKLRITRSLDLSQSETVPRIIYYPTEPQLTLVGHEAKALADQITAPANVSVIEKEAYSRQITKPIADGNSAFAFDLYQQLKAEDGNLFFSPYSISTALAMTYAGAKGETAAQMAGTLHFDLPEQQFHQQYGFLIDQLNQQGWKRDYQLSIANALWMQKDYHFLQEYRGIQTTLYDATFAEVDFVNETETTRQKINKWVEQQTEDKIKDLLPQGVLDAKTRLVLTNAIYFKGDWALKFDAKVTKDSPFYISANKQVTAPLMYQNDKFKYGENKETQFLELPYKGDDLSMLVLLPKKGQALAKLEDQLTAENLAAWQKRMFKQELDVYLPKFMMTSSFSLAETLKAMGMTDAFDVSRADFSGMTGSTDLYISAVMHKAFVEVNEEGTEAAAATGVVMSLTAMPGPPPVFRADRPFVFIIRDNNTSSILFVGRMTNPTKEN